MIGENHRVYAVTGDGDFDPGAGNFGDSVVAASLEKLENLDYFTPINWRGLSKYDMDISSSSPVWFGYGDYTLLAVGGKESLLYLLNADSLGAKDHHSPLYITPQLANDEGTFEGKGIFGAPSVWRDQQGETWLYVPIWGPVSKNAPKFPQTNGPAPHGCIMAFRVITDSTTKKPILEPAWVAGDLDVPEPVVIANGVVFALSTGENVRRTQEGGIFNRKVKVLSEAEVKANTKPSTLYALDAKSGKTLYESGNAMESWVHFSGLAVADGQVYAVDHDSRVYCFGLKEK